MASITAGWESEMYSFAYDWDYHSYNLLLRDEGSAVVIDWTALDITDSRFDLAWTLVLVSLYEGAQWRNRILQEYERLAGAKVEHIECFEVFACARRFMECLEPSLDAIHLQKVDSAFLSFSKRASGQKCPKWTSGSQNSAFRG